MRTEAYGAVRAAAGLLISSYTVNHHARRRDPAGENTAGIAALKQAMTISETFSAAAAAHQTVALAARAGTYAKNASVLDASAPPLQALFTAVSGTVKDHSIESASAEAAEKHTALANGKLPHTGDAITGISVQAGLGVDAGQSLQLASGETVTAVCGQDSQYITGGSARNHTGQAVGVLGGASRAGENEPGLQLIAAKDANDFQALRDTATVQARDDVSVTSTGAHIDWAAAKSIRMSTAGGANIMIEGGNITVQCPGKLTVRAGKKSLMDPATLDYLLPRLPREVCIECLLKALKSGSALSLK